MILTVLVACIIAGIALATIGVVGVLWGLITRRLQLGMAEDDVWDSTGEQVIEHFEILKGDTVVIPITPGRKAPDVEPVEARFDVGPDLLALARRRAEFAYLQTYVFTSLCARQGPGRHRAVGLTDANRAAIKAPTQAFAALVLEETGFELVAVGPREAELPVDRRVWTKQGWEQEVLDLEGVA